jgi:hypothetical protein
MERKEYEVSRTMPDELKQRNTDRDEKERVVAATVVLTIWKKGG